LKVFENWVLRRIFGPKRKEATGGWRKLNDKKFITCKLQKPSVISITKSRRIIWAAHLQHGTDKKSSENLQERDHLEDLCVNERILEWVL
jgi:hypothetical protein